MIFVTVGTHEQPFNRLIEEIDNLKKEGLLLDEVFIQTGFSTYEPKYCKWESMLSYAEMEEYLTISDIIVTHGGPATFMGVLSKGKVPIVVPRLERFGEHVNDHQLEFVKRIVNKGYELFIVEDIKQLVDLLQATPKSSHRSSNNKNFCEQFSIEVEQLMK